MEILVPVADTYGDMIVGSPNHVVTLDEKALTIFYNYEYGKLLDADNPDAGILGDKSRVFEEYTIPKSSIKLVCLIRDEQTRAFSVGIDATTIYYDIQVGFNRIKDARKFKDTITAWWLEDCEAF